MLHFTCAVAAIMKREKTNGISLSHTYTSKHITVKMPRSSCVGNCSNNAKSQPDLNFVFCLPTSNGVVVGCNQLVVLRLMKMEKFWTTLGLPKHGIIVFVLNILLQVSGNVPLCIILKLPYFYLLSTFLFVDDKDLAW